MEKFLKQELCPVCGGTRLNERARSSLLCGITLGEAAAMTLDALIPWVKAVPASMPEELRDMAESICGQFLHTARRLTGLGLGYLSLDRAGDTLSTGERQRVQLARAVRSRTTGVLYVLDEPSIGLHPANVDGLLGMMDDLIAHGNSVVLVDHDTRVLKASDWLIEMGPGAGQHGGNVLAQGSLEDVAETPDSLIAGFLTGEEPVLIRKRTPSERMFEQGHIRISTAPLHTVHALDLDIPKGRLVAVTGVSGSGKTTLILESLIPALQASGGGTRLPDHVKAADAPGIRRVSLIDSTPVGINVRSTVATYSGVLDELRKLYAATHEAKEQGCRVSDFSYNTGSLRCAGCEGTGQITMDVQFLPDVEIVCPDCGGSRYGKEADAFRSHGISLPELMGMTVEQALERFCDVRKVRERLQVLADLGLGYLTLGEATPALSGGEAQRLKLASEIGKAQDDAVFVFDEPTIGLHPLDVRVLIGVFQKFIDAGATIIVIEHDLDMIANADYVVDMGPGGGDAGGRIVAAGTPEEISRSEESLTGKYLKKIMK
nr:ATP-binding cassette domain-containing protein [Hungatella effluvii]